MKMLTDQDCAGLEPGMFVVNMNLGAGGSLAPQVAAMLDPIVHASFLFLTGTKEQGVKLHFHEFDEYWLFGKCRSVVQIRLPDGRSGRFEVGPGWGVYCVRGVEHGHEPLEDWNCYQFNGIAREGIELGHRSRTFKA